MKMVFKRKVFIIVFIGVLISSCLISSVCAKELDPSKLLILYTRPSVDGKHQDLYLNNMTNTMKEKLIENIITGDDTIYVEFLNENKLVYVIESKPNNICYFDRSTSKTDTVMIPADLQPYYKEGIIVSPNSKYVFMSFWQPNDFTLYGYLIETDTKLVKQIIKAVPDSVNFSDNNENLLYLEFKSFSPDTKEMTSYYNTNLIELNLMQGKSRIMTTYKRSISAIENSIKINHKRNKIVYCKDYTLDPSRLSNALAYINNYAMLLKHAPNYKLFISDISLKSPITLWRSMKDIAPERWSYDDEVVIFKDDCEGYYANFIFYDVKRNKTSLELDKIRSRYYIPSLRQIIYEKYMGYRDQRSLDELWCIDDHGENIQKIDTEWMWEEFLNLIFIRSFYYMDK